MRPRAWLVSLGCALLTGCATVPRAPQPFLDRMYVSRVRGDTSLMYEAQVATSIFMVDGLGDAYQKMSLQPDAPHADAWRVVLTPMFRVRQLNDSSAAVRTPSFMPKVAVEWLRATRLGTSRTNPVVEFSGANLTGVRLTLAHHSNGQAGCFRDGFVPVDARSNECVAAPGADTMTVRLNRANGDFSSTFVSLMIHSTWMNRFTNDEPTWWLGGAVGADWHVPGIFGELSREQRELYGSWRLHGTIEGARRFGVACADRVERTPMQKAACLAAGRSRLTLDGERAPEHPGALSWRIQPAVLPYRWSVELSHTLDGLLGLGPFVRWHDGQDYYNIGFVNRRKVFMFGVMMDLGGYDHLGAKAM